MITYKEFLKNMKFLDDNFDDMYKIRRFSLYYSDNDFEFDFYLVGRNVDIDVLSNSISPPNFSSLEIFLDSKKEGLKDFFIGNYRIDIDSNFIKKLTYEDIDSIDEVELTLRNGRLNVPFEERIKAIPSIVNRYLECLRQNEL